MSYDELHAAAQAALKRHPYTRARDVTVDRIEERVDNLLFFMTAEGDELIVEASRAKALESPAYAVRQIVQRARVLLRHIELHWAERLVRTIQLHLGDRHVGRAGAPRLMVVDNRLHVDYAHSVVGSVIDLGGRREEPIDHLAAELAETIRARMKAPLPPP